MKQLAAKMQMQFILMCTTNNLFVSEVTGSRLWEHYLGNFPGELDPIFRDPASSTHNCNNCNNFIRRYGNIVAIDEDLNIMTIFDVEGGDEYQASLDAMSGLLKGNDIQGIFMEDFRVLNKELNYSSTRVSDDVFQIGVDKNVKRYTKEESEAYPGVVKENEVVSFHHMHLSLPKKFVNFDISSVESINAEKVSNVAVFQRAMMEFRLDSMLLIRDLILQGSLLNADSYLEKLKSFIEFKLAYDEVHPEKKFNWCWKTAVDLPFAKFRNELMGVLVTEISEGMELNKACLNWNKRADPANYMKAVSPITEREKDVVKQVIVLGGYEDSFKRRMATLKDIKAREIQHLSVTTEGIKPLSIFDNLKTTNISHKRTEFGDVVEMGIDKFMKDVLPTCTSVELYLDRKLKGNLVSLTTAEDTKAKSIFKWDNPFSWTYKGNLAGKSMIKEAVKSQGGNVEGVLRFSIMWSGGNSTDDSDLDAHCIEPAGEEIYFGNKRSRIGGHLDIDITVPLAHKSSGKGEVVENIAYSDLSRMKDGRYTFSINQFSARNSQGYKAEIEFNGKIYNYESIEPVRDTVIIATVTLKDGVFSILHHDKPSETESEAVELYGLKSEAFHKVNLMCLSPNFWGENKVGNKHYFFMLQDAIAGGKLRSYHCENLNDTLVPHRKVLEYLANVTEIDATVPQLSGVGFNATVRDEVILKLKGNFNRVVKIKF